MANESSGKKALKAGLGYTVGNMLVKGLSFLAIPLFSRLMTVEDFGIYSTFSSYVMIMTVLAGSTPASATQSWTMLSAPGPIAPR